MIYGIGIDVVHVPRIKEIVERWGDRFLGRVFTEDEISYCKKKRNPYPSFAVRFAAKEAFIKAIGAATSLSLTDVRIVNSDSGKPSLEFSGNISVHIKNENITATHVSLSHDHEYAIALVLLEKSALP